MLYEGNVLVRALAWVLLVGLWLAVLFVIEWLR